MSTSSINVTECELHKYGIVHRMFTMLPPKMQREQLTADRAPGVTLYKAKRLSRSPGFVFRPPPPAKAVYMDELTLKQQSEVRSCT